MPARSRRRIALLSCFFLLSLNSWSQGAKIRPEQDMEESDRDRQSEMDDVRAREEWFRANRTIPGERSAELLHRAYQQKQQLQEVQELLRPNSTSSLGKAAQSPTPMPLSSPTLGTVGNMWQSLGPGPMISDATGAQSYGQVDGRLTSVAVDQGSGGSIVYIGAAFGGVWKSTNANATDPTTVTWTPLIDNQPTLAVGAIALQPTTSGPSSVVLVGTGEPNSSGDSYYGMGILRSTDAGSSWTLISGADCVGGICNESFAGMGFSSFAFGPATGSPTTQTVVASTAATNGATKGGEKSNSVRGIYYSLDAGTSWRLATVTDSGGPISPGSVSSVVYNAAANRFYAAIRFHGFFTSADGITWTRLADVNQPGANQPPGSGLTTANCPTMVPTTTASNCPIVRGQIAVKPGTADMYVIFVDGNEVNQGLFLTTNAAGGTPTWTKIKTAGSCNDGVGPCQKLDVNPKDANDPNTVTDTGVEETDTTQTPSTHLLLQGAYDLWLAAIPTAGGTDVMVGTRNVYKCSVTSSNPTCSTAFSWKNLTHVYDCNPLAAPAHVHPDQHGFDYLLTDPTKMFFANDGGVYRSTTGAANDGSCHVQANFDNLNANLGSVSEFVSFSQDRHDPNTILGGLQDNGSPAIAPSLASSPLWTAVNNGDGGYNEIDPNTPSIWYTTNTRVSLQQCTSAPSCTFATFGDPAQGFRFANIGSAQVSGDTSEFYMPFTLDPAQTSNVVLGTCRVWRGPGSGGSAWSASNAISPMFDAHNPVATSCSSPSSGGQTQIRSIAVGGPAPSGSSQVIYVGLDGNGQTPGHLWVTFNGDANPPTWTDVTGNINTSLPISGGVTLHFGISDIWIDKIDSTGQTAYATVQGFGVGHIYRTTNGGGSWTDISAGLPDAPANTVITDQDDKNTIYLGTDVGAFIGKTDPSTGIVSWFNFGTGLPNVPVTRLRLFESAEASAKRVRASTYGRGMWEINLGPDYVLSFPTISTTVESNTPTMSFNGLLIPFNGYVSSVNLSSDKSNLNTALLTFFSCTGGGSFTPAAPGTPFSFTATGNKVGTYNFAIRATGSDTPPTNHVQVLALNVISQFNVSASPASATVSKGNTASYTINLNATPDSNGGFGGSVALSCSAGLPQATTCVFSQANPSLSGAVTPVTLAIGTRTSQVNAMNSTIPLQIYAAVFPVFGLVVMGIGGAARARRKKLFLLGLLILGLAIFAVGCGGGSHSTPITLPPPNTGTPTGTFTITVAATSGNVQHTTQVTLTVQ